MAITTYVLGHDSSTLASHQSRSAEIQADYLIPHIKPAYRILDVGCGPGTITCSLTSYVPEGRVVGIDYSKEALKHAREEAEKRKLYNIIFQVASAHELPFEDNSFDVVHCHAVLVHLPNALAALKEMRRVCRQGGFIAAREPDWATCVIHPYDARLELWKELHIRLKCHEGAEPNAGRFLAEWAMAAGFEQDNVEVTSNVLEYFGSGREWWGQLCASRMKGEFGKRAVESGIASEEDMENLVAAWLDWSKKPSGIWTLTHMRLLAQK